MIGFSFIACIESYYFIVNNYSTYATNDTFSDARTDSLELSSIFRWNAGVMTSYVGRDTQRYTMGLVLFLVNNIFHFM